MRANFHTNLVQKLSGLSYPVQERTVTKQTRTVIEARQIDTNPYFRDLQEYTEWCQNKLKELLAADYGSDLPSVKAELERHQQEHRVIDKFHSKVQHAERQQANFSGDELNLYQQRLSQLQKVYAELLSTSTKRLSDLDALQNFLQSASAELQWLNDREQVEIQRDWAAKDLDLPGIHRYYEVSPSPSIKRRNYALASDRSAHFIQINCFVQWTHFKRNFGSGEEVSKSSHYACVALDVDLYRFPLMISVAVEFDSK